VSFTPNSPTTIVVGQVEFPAPAGVTVTNWKDRTVVAQKQRSGTASRPACRSAADINEVVVHETVSTKVDRKSAGRPNIHLVLHRDGTFTQHADLVADLNHANHHNMASFGFETVNPVLPRMASAPDGGLPPNLTDFPCIQNTIWASADRPKLEAGGHGPARNPGRHYVRPTDAQLEAAARLIAWATDSTIGHGMNIPLNWRGRRGQFLLLGRDDPLFANHAPGIHAHGYWNHSDGCFIVLYAWLRLDQNLSQQDALDTACDIAQNKTVQRSESGGRRTPHADLHDVLHP